MSNEINIGFVPLVDCVPLVVAHELGFAAKEGLTLNLQKQPSWSALRDMLAMDQLDAAHLLSPLPIAMSAGLSGRQVMVDNLMTLSVNGNVIVAGQEVLSQMRAAGWERDIADPTATAKAIAASRKEPLRFGIPFPHSMHRELVDYWFAGFDVDVTFVSVPPPLMAESLAAKEIDAFCVGEPWGSQAVDTEAGEIILLAQSIWSFSPEKVLGARRDWIEEHKSEAAALMRAVYQACLWLNQDPNRAFAADLLAQPIYLDLPVDVIERALTGQLLLEARTFGVNQPEFITFHAGAANFPWRSQADWIAVQMARRLGVDEASLREIARASYRSDLYREVFAPMVDLPGASSKQEGALRHPTAVASTRGGLILAPDAFFDGAIFDMVEES